MTYNTSDGFEKRFYKKESKFFTTDDWEKTPDDGVIDGLQSLAKGYIWKDQNQKSQVVPERHFISFEAPEGYKVLYKYFDTREEADKEWTTLKKSTNIQIQLLKDRGYSEN